MDEQNFMDDINLEIGNNSYKTNSPKTNSSKYRNGKDKRGRYEDKYLKKYNMIIFSLICVILILIIFISYNYSFESKYHSNKEHIYKSDSKYDKYNIIRIKSNDIDSDNIREEPLSNFNVDYIKSNTPRIPQKNINKKTLLSNWKRYDFTEKVDANTKLDDYFIIIRHPKDHGILWFNMEKLDYYHLCCSILIKNKINISVCNHDISKNLMCIISNNRLIIGIKKKYIADLASGPNCQDKNCKKNKNNRKNEKIITSFLKSNELKLQCKIIWK